MRRRRTLVVLGALAAIVGGLVLWDRGRPSTDDARAAKGRLAPGFDRARVNAIEIARPGEKVRLARDGEGWWLDGPRRRADDAAVDAIFGELELGSIDRRLGRHARPDAKERARLGLDAPRVTLTVGAVRLRVGGEAPGGNGVYVARDGEEEVFVVEKRLLEVTDLGRDALTSRRLTVAAPERARRIVLGKVVLARGERGWRVGGERAQPDLVDAFVAALDGARALAILDGATASAPGGAGVTLALDDRVEATLRGARPDCRPPERVPIERADGAVLCFDGKLIAKLAADAGRLRDPRLVPFAVDEIARVGVDAGGRSLALERVDRSWRMIAEAGAAQPADDAAVREWLAALAALPAQPAERADGETGQALGTVSLFTGDDRVTLAFVRLLDGKRAAHRLGEDGALLIVPAAVDALVDAQPERFRPRRVLAFFSGDAQRLSIEEAGVVESAERAQGGGWRLTRPEKLAADDATVGRMLAALSTLRADRFEAARATPPPERTISVGLRAGAAVLPSLALWPADAAGCHAELLPPRARSTPTSSTTPAPTTPLPTTPLPTTTPFHLAPETCADLTPHVASRVLFDLAGDRLVAVDVEGRGARVQVERRGGAWTANGAPLAAARVDELVERLRTFTAERVLGYGAAPPIAPRTTVRVAGDDRPVEVLEIGASSGGEAPARLRGRHVLYRLRLADLTALVAAARPR